MEARNANLKVREKTSQCIIFSLSGCVKIFAEEFSVIYLFNWNIKNGFVNYIEIILSLFDVTPSIKKFLMLLSKVLQGSQNGRTSFFPGKLHL